MKTKLTLNRQRGYTLIEALVALLIVVLSLYAAATMQSQILRGSGDAKSRSQAVAIAQRNLESARSIAIRGNFNAMAANCGAASPDAAFTVACTVSTPGGGLDQRLVEVSVAWTDSAGNQQTVALNSMVGWENVASLVVGANAQAQPSIAPLGAAQVGIGQYSPLPTGQGVSDNQDGTITYRNGGRIELISQQDGKILLYIDPINGDQQEFVVISGNVYFDQNAGNNSIPPSADVRVRLSSEGVCIYDNAVNTLLDASGGSNTYKYFSYNCYVGAGWYGNVGVTIDDDVSGQASSPTVCLGDPGFNSGTSNGTLTSAHTREASVRTFRGFKPDGQLFLATGMQDASRYPSALTPGSPVPGDYPSFYPNVTSNYFNHHFLLTRLQGQSTCQTKMEGGVFAQNAGKYFCITPDNDPATDACPSVWPGFEAEVGNGGSINFSLTVAKSSVLAGDGLVQSAPAGIACGDICSASFASGTSVTLTATPSLGSLFTGWGGCDSSSGNTCTVGMNGAKNVTATFTGAATTYALSVTNSGTGTGTVTSSPSGISCGATCTASYLSGTTVTLTAATATGSTFAGWSGACTGTGSCVVTMSQAANVTANFTGAAPTCNIQISGSRATNNSDILLVSPITGGGSCSGGTGASYSCTVSVPNTASAQNPEIVTLLNQRTTPANQAYSYTKNLSVTSCGSITNVNFP